MKYVRIPYQGYIYPMNRARDQYSIAEAGLVAEEKEHEERRQTLSSQPLIFCFNDVSEAVVTDKETEEGELSNSLKTRAKRRVLNSLVRNAGTNFGKQSLRHRYVPIHAGRKRCKSCQRMEMRIVRKDNLRLERTRSNTQTIMGSCEIQHCKHASGNREQVANVGL